MLSVPEELAPILQELCLLYSKGDRDAVKDGLLALIANLKLDGELSQANYQSLPVEDEGKDNFLKSWHDILDLRVYVDTEIYGTLDHSPPEKVTELGNVVKHQEAADAYAKTWLEIGEKLAHFPDDLFSRQWSTAELAEFLHCSPSRLRRAKSKNLLPLQIESFLIDCTTSGKGHKLIWRIQPL